MKDTNSIAKTVLVSCTLTTLIIIGLLYVLREPIAFYLYAITQDDKSEVVTSFQASSEPVVSAVERVNPSVVSVIVTKDVPIYERYYERVNPWGFFGELSIPRLREGGFTEQKVGGGSGFIVSTDGLIVTNYHVVSDVEARYSIVLNDGTVYPVIVLDSDPDMDIAILKIDQELPGPLPVAVLGDSSNLRLGQTVIAIGNALAEFQNSISTGVISGLARSIEASDSKGKVEQLHQVIQTDAAINPGNSGGPLLNIDGEVIGVNVAVSREANNIGFAIPSRVVENIVVSVQKYGRIVRPYLGVQYITVSSRMSELNNLPVLYGALVTSEGAPNGKAILPDSPAELAGLEVGDIIIAVGGVSLENRDLATVLRTLKIDEPLVLELVRSDDYLLLEVTLKELPATPSL